jgi:hypothetical protein
MTSLMLISILLISTTSQLLCTTICHLVLTSMPVKSKSSQLLCTPWSVLPTH